MTVAPEPSVAPHRGQRMLARTLVAAVSGLLLALAFPPFGLLSGWLAVPAFALFLATFQTSVLQPRPLASPVAAVPTPTTRQERVPKPAGQVGTRLRARHGALLGASAGAGFFLLLLDWLRVLGPDAWILLSALCIAFWAAAGALLPRLLASPMWVLTVPLLWVCVEAARDRVPFGGFPWGRLAFAQGDTPLLGWAGVGGPALVTFVVALAGCLVLSGVRALTGRRWARTGVALGGVAALAISGAALLRPAWGGPVITHEPVALVQGNVPRLGLDFNNQRRAVLDNHVRVTEALAAEVASGKLTAPVAVIWPENASDVDPLRAADAAAQIDRAADAIGAPILVGAILADPATVLNVSLVWDPETGPGDRYAKRHPVPFGEYLPFRSLLSRYITRFERIPRDFAAGDDAGVLQLGPIPTGVVICFEIAYDGLVRDAVRAGGQVLVVQTNNATYGRTGQPQQQLAITRVQAVTSGRTTLVAATSGVSAVIDERGTVRWQTEEFTSGSTVAEVPLRAGLTPAVRLGALPELAAVLALGAVMVLTRRRRPALAPRPELVTSAPRTADRAGDPRAHGTLDQ